MADHRTLDSSQVHEPKHISSSAGTDAGKVITPTVAGGVSELRRLVLADLADGSNALTEASLLANDTINYQGWEMVEDGLVTTPTIVVDTNPTKLTIDDEGVSNNTNEDYLPLSIRGSGNLWNRSLQKIQPITVGDTYDLRINLEITATSGTPEVLTMLLDIGNTTSPSVVIAEDARSVNKTAPYTITFSVPVFCLNTFFTNGCQVFLKTKAGTVTVGGRSIFLTRTGSGDN